MKVSVLHLRCSRTFCLAGPHLDGSLYSYSVFAQGTCEPAGMKSKQPVIDVSQPCSENMSTVINLCVGSPGLTTLVEGRGGICTHSWVQSRAKIYEDVSIKNDFQNVHLKKTSVRICDLYTV